MSLRGTFCSGVLAGVGVGRFFWVWILFEAVGDFFLFRLQVSLGGFLEDFEVVGFCCNEKAGLKLWFFSSFFLLYI